MTKQEYYDLLVQTSKDGGFPSNGETGCLYLSPDGKRCAIGVLIPPEVIEEKILSEYLNGSGLDHMLRRWPEATQYFPEGMTLEDMNQVQWTHDLFDGRKWDHNLFVSALNKLDCFQLV